MAFKKVAQHGQVQGLAETPGTGNEQYLCSCIYDVLDEKGFVDKQEATPTQLSEIAYANADSFHFLFLFNHPFANYALSTDTDGHGQKHYIRLLPSLSVPHSGLFQLFNTLNPED